MTTSAPNPAPKVTTLTRPEVELDVDLDAEVPCGVTQEEVCGRPARWRVRYRCGWTFIYCDHHRELTFARAARNPAGLLRCGGHEWEDVRPSDATWHRL